MFGAEKGDEVALDFCGPSSADVAAAWRAVGAERRLLPHNENRFLSWLWTEWTEADAELVAHPGTAYS